jgi:hypothetical protein
MLDVKKRFRAGRSGNRGCAAVLSWRTAVSGVPAAVREWTQIPESGRSEVETGKFSGKHLFSYVLLAAFRRCWSFGMTIADEYDGNLREGFDGAF